MGTVFMLVEPVVRIFLRLYLQIYLGLLRRFSRTRGLSSECGGRYRPMNYTFMSDRVGIEEL